MGEPFLRAFVIDGEERHDTTYRTGLIEHYTTVPDKTFLDLGAADGYESRALALRGARAAVAVEGKRSPFEAALAAKEALGLPNHEVRRLDVRRIDEYGLGTFDVVLCFGLLYHLRNPFNLLKRVRSVTGELLLLETHVAPRSRKGLLAKHAEALPAGIHRIELDGIPFEGKVVEHRGDPELTKGSLDAAWTFWLTTDALMKALVRAGFRIEDFHHELDAGAPAAVQAGGRVLGFGHANTKVWIAAAPRPGGGRSAGDPVERLLEVREPPLERALRAGRALRRRLG